MPRPARISREAILDATLAIAEQGGLDAVSMRSVATRLAVTPMALYHHVQDKDDLLDGLVERLLNELPIPEPSLPWQQRLEALALSLRSTAARHPDAFLMLFRRPATTPGALRARESVYRALLDAGVAEALIPRTERLLSTFMIGFAASEAGGRFANHEPPTLEEDLQWTRSLIAAALLPPGPDPLEGERDGGRSRR